MVHVYSSTMERTNIVYVYVHVYVWPYHVRTHVYHGTGTRVPVKWYHWYVPWHVRTMWYSSTMVQYHWYMCTNITLSQKQLEIQVRTYVLTTYHGCTPSTIDTIDTNGSYTYHLVHVYKYI